MLPLAGAAEDSSPGSPQILLKMAMDARPKVPSEDERTAVWLEMGLRCELLTRHGRLLPESFPADERKRLAAALPAADPASEAALEKLLATFPHADALVFDGRRYAGANLRSIDPILGFSGRPIAFDRALPALLVPLSPRAETALAVQQAAFQADPATSEIRADANHEHGTGAAALMLGDGQFLRGYSGRFDDLYFHLFQNGNGASALAFCALADGLVERVYQPVTGIRRAGSQPPAAFDLDDILSDGGKTAVFRYLRTQSAHASEPFQRFAFRVLPTIVAKARTLPPGARFTASHAEILQALRARQHLYPTQVPPLYRSPDRFLGWAGSFFMPVANNPVLPPGAADSWFPLPQQGGRGASDQAADAASGVQLFESSSTVDMVWEDPQLSNLLADPENRSAAPAVPANKPSPASPPVPKVESDPRLRATPGHLIAIVTPTAEEARAYFAAIAESDEKLRVIEQRRGRIRLLRQFIESARGASLDPSFKPLQQAMEADLTSFGQREAELAGHLQITLKARAELRSALAHRLQSERVAPLQSLGEKPGEADPSTPPTQLL